RNDHHGRARRAVPPLFRGSEQNGSHEYSRRADAGAWLPPRRALPPRCRDRTGRDVHGPPGHGRAPGSSRRRAAARPAARPPRRPPAGAQGRMGAMSPPDGQLPGPGSLLDGRYRLDAVIARGGMSMVHLATDERLDRHVAVKLLDPVLAGDRAFVDRFTLEARSAARLSDPGIVQVFDQGVEGETPFLVMELVPGGTLRELLDERGPMPPYAAAAVLRPLLGALREAHDAGLVHRDIKPEN